MSDIITEFRNENTKNIDPTIVNGTAAIPAAVIARTTLIEQ